MFQQHMFLLKWSFVICYISNYVDVDHVVILKTPVHCYRRCIWDLISLISAIHAKSRMLYFVVLVPLDTILLCLCGSISFQSLLIINRFLLIYLRSSLPRKLLFIQTNKKRGMPFIHVFMMFQLMLFR